MTKQKRQYQQLEADVLHSKLGLQYLKNSKTPRSEKRSLLRRVVSSFPFLLTVGKVVLSSQTVSSRLITILASFLLSRFSRSKRLKKGYK